MVEREGSLCSACSLALTCCLPGRRSWLMIGQQRVKGLDEDVRGMSTCRGFQCATPRHETCEMSVSVRVR